MTALLIEKMSFTTDEGKILYMITIKGFGVKKNIMIDETLFDKLPDILYRLEV